MPACTTRSADLGSCLREWAGNDPTRRAVVATMEIIAATSAMQAGRVAAGVAARRSRRLHRQQHRRRPSTPHRRRCPRRLRRRVGRLAGGGARVGGGGGHPPAHPRCPAAGGDRSTGWFGQPGGRRTGGDDLLHPPRTHRSRGDGRRLPHRRYRPARRRHGAVRAGDGARTDGRRRNRRVRARRDRGLLPAHPPARAAHREGLASSRSTRPTGGTGRRRCARTSPISPRVPTGRARPTSTCAGSVRWSPTRTGSCCAVASSCTPTTAARATPRAVCAWSTKRSRSPCCSSSPVARPPTAAVASSN